MKKEYMTPFVEIVKTEFQNLICWSGTGAAVDNFSSEDEWPDDTEDGDD